MTPANFETWRNRKLWTIYELAFLLLGWEPEEEREDGQWHQIDHELDKAENFYEYLRSIAVRDPDVRVLNPNNKKYHAPTDAVDSIKLLRWVTALEGVDIPSELASILDRYENSKTIGKAANKKISEKDSLPLGKKEKENLLVTIALLTLVVVENTDIKTGDVSEPNYSEVVRKCQNHAKDISGMAASSLSGRISEGMNLLKKRAKSSS